MNADGFGLPISACICVYLRFNFHCCGPIRTNKGNSIFLGAPPSGVKPPCADAGNYSCSFCTFLETAH